LELDTLLHRFVKRNYDDMSCEQRELLAELLEHEYAKLNAWLVDGTVPDSDRVVRLIELIRLDFQAA